MQNTNNKPQIILYVATIVPVLDEEPTSFKVIVKPTFEAMMIAVNDEHAKRKRHFEPSYSDHRTGFVPTDDAAVKVHIYEF